MQAQMNLYIEASARRSAQRGRASDRRGVGVTWSVESGVGGVKRPGLEGLKSKSGLILDARKRKNLTHLQLILLFKDSTGFSAGFTAPGSRDRFVHRRASA